MSVKVTWRNHIMATGDPAPVLGTISDLSATAAVESAVLTWTAAENATSHQPEYKLSSSGTWLTFGSALGSSATGVTVTGLTALLAYDFRVVASDGSNTTTSNVDSVTPDAAVEPPSEDLDEPDGLTILASADGTVAQSGSNALGVSWLGAWGHDGETLADRVAVISDSTNPTGSGQSVQLTYVSASNPDCAGATGSFPEPLQELYIRMRVFYESGWSIGHKHFYVESGPGASDDMYVTREPNGVLFAINQGGTPFVIAITDNDEHGAPVRTPPNPFATNTWHEVKVHLIGESEPAAGDGECHILVDGNVMADRTGISWADDGLFTGFEFFFDSEQAHSTSTMRLGEFYVSGRGVAPEYNEPTGEGWGTIFHADGTSKDYGGLASESDVVVVTDVDAPNGQAVEWRWPNGAPAGAAEGYFVSNFNGSGGVADMGPVREIYYRMVMRWNPDWDEHGGGDKLMYFGHVGRSSGYFLSLRGEKSNGMQSVTFQNQAPNVGPSSFFFLDNDIGIVPLDEGYVTIEVHMVAQSTAAASDGEMHVWVNGDPISLQLWDETPLTGTAMRWVTSGDVRFEGFEWYPYWGGDDGPTKGVSPYDWVRFGELYISGKV